MYTACPGPQKGEHEQNLVAPLYGRHTPRERAITAATACQGIDAKQPSLPLGDENSRIFVHFSYFLVKPPREQRAVSIS